MALTGVLNTRVETRSAACDVISSAADVVLCSLQFSRCGRHTNQTDSDDETYRR